MADDWSQNNWKKKKKIQYEYLVYTCVFQLQQFA